MKDRLQLIADALEAYEAKSREIVEKLDTIVTRMEIRQKNYKNYATDFNSNADSRNATR